MIKPIEEYYLHDHGEGNGWQVRSTGPGNFGVVTTSQVKEDRGVIQLDLEKYIHGVLNMTDNETFMLSPEEAYDIGTALLTAAEDGEGVAVSRRIAAEVVEEDRMRDK
jgi:dTDP-4-dehydrorhamnose 3,5-epimerase-like enzyme